MRNPLFVSVIEVDNRDKRADGQNKKHRRQKKWLKGLEVITGIAVFIAIVVGLVAYVRDVNNNIDEHKLNAKRYADEQYKEDLERREEEKKRQPQIRASIGNVILLGKEKYQEIYLMNTNPDIMIESGCFSVDYRIMVQSKEFTINCYLKDVVYQPIVNYLDEFGGSILLIKKDYPNLIDDVKVKLKEQGINVGDAAVLQPYLFAYYEFTCGGKNLSGYYKVEIRGERCGAVEEVRDPESYFEVYKIE